jgi:hypothetical protein
MQNYGIQDGIYVKLDVNVKTESVRPYSHGTTQKKLKGYASHQMKA